MSGKAGPGDWTYDAQVASVHDGDTVTLSVVLPAKCYGKLASLQDLGFRIIRKGRTLLLIAPFRLAGCNAQELNLPGGPEAGNALRALLPVGSSVQIHSIKVTQQIQADKYDRWDAYITLPDGRDVTATMIAQGWAAPWDGTGPKPVPPWPNPNVPTAQGEPPMPIPAPPSAPPQDTRDQGIPAVPDPPQLNSVTWWIALLTVLGNFAVAVGVLIGHPLQSAVVNSVVTAVALMAATVAALFTHRSVVSLKMVHYQAQVDQHQALVAAHLRKLETPEPEMLTASLESIELRGTPENPMFVQQVKSTPPPRKVG